MMKKACYEEERGLLDLLTFHLAKYNIQIV